MPALCPSASLASDDEINPQVIEEDYRFPYLIPVKVAHIVRGRPRDRRIEALAENAAWTGTHKGWLLSAYPNNPVAEASLPTPGRWGRCASAGGIGMPPYGYSDRLQECGVGSREHHSYLDF